MSRTYCISANGADSGGHDGVNAQLAQLGRGAARVAAIDAHRCAIGRARFCSSAHRALAHHGGSHGQLQRGIGQRGVAAYFVIAKTFAVQNFCKTL